MVPESLSDNNFNDQFVYLLPAKKLGFKTRYSHCFNIQFGYFIFAQKERFC